MACSLPNETLSAILDNLQPPDLAHVACVSRRFRLVAERVLYVNIAIAESLPHSAPAPTKTATCCSTILARPHLAELVKRLTVRWQTDPGPREPYMPHVAPALALLNRALRTLVALDTLELTLGLAGAPAPAPDLLAHVRLPALRVFALSGLGRGALPAKHAAAPAPAISAFLAATPTIEHLRLFDRYEPLPLPAGALPALGSFLGSAAAAAAVLPGRPVRTLGLVGHEFVTEADLRRIALASARVRRLDLSMMSVTPLLLRDISRHLGDAVEQLRIKLALRHTLHFSMSGISILAGLSPVLGAFPLLHQLDLSPTTVDAIGPGNALEESALCTTWTRACPALREVVFPSKTEWRRAPPADVWVAQTAALWTR